MKSKHITMSVEEFESIEHPFGWKAEYYLGKGHLTPREHLVRNQLVLAPPAIVESRQTGNPSNPATQIARLARIVPVEPSLKERMIQAFFEAFEDAVEFCDWSVDEIQTHAAKNINNYFQGVRGQPHPVSRVVIEPSSSQQIVGVALFVKKEEEQIEIDLLLVRPSHQRIGIATRMVASAIDILAADGVTELCSGYHICNEGSRAWHHSLGFRDVPDYLYCRLKASWYRDRIWRCEQLGDLGSIEELRVEKDRWERLSEELLLARREEVRSSDSAATVQASNRIIE